MAWRIHFLWWWAWLCVVASPAWSQEAGAIEFDAIVDTEGNRVHFVYDEAKDDLEEVVRTWCGSHVAEGLAAECAVVLNEQVAVTQRERATPTVELDVKVDASGTLEKFGHVKGQDLRKEAADFCRKFAPADGLDACTHTLATAAMDKANKAETIWGDLFGLTALRGGTQRRGVFDADDVSVDDTVGNAKVVGVLFAADWCKPCKQFMPVLTKFYDRLHKRKNFEIIWVSGSRDRRSYDAFLADMPWLAMAFDPHRAQALQSAFAVKGFPTFLVFDSAGNLITADGVQKVSKDPFGLTFPYRSPAQQLARFGRFLLSVPLFLTRPFRPNRNKRDHEAPRYNS